MQGAARRRAARALPEPTQARFTFSRLILTFNLEVVLARLQQTCQNKQSLQVAHSRRLRAQRRGRWSFISGSFVLSSLMSL